MGELDLGLRLGGRRARRVAEPLEQLLHVGKLCLEVLAVPGQPLDELLAVGEPATAATEATMVVVVMSFTHDYAHLLPCQSIIVIR